MPDRAARPAGILIPVTTPFDSVRGDIAPVAFRENLRRWLEHPLDGVVLFGTTGEGPLLDEEEKLRLLGFARDLVRPDLWLAAGVHAESTRGAIREARRLAEAGADALLVRVPAYFGSALSPAALRDYFTAVADEAPAPVILYQIPKHTHVTLEPGLVAELARHPNVVALKDSSGDLKRLGEYAEACAGACSLLVGNGALLYAGLELGAAGGILGVALLAPAECAALLRHHRAGDGRAAGALQERIGPLHRAVVARYGPPGVKAALDLLGYTGGPPRPPLAPLGPRERDEVARALAEAGVRG